MSWLYFLVLGELVEVEPSEPPKVQAHLSPFSYPERSNHAVPSGSVTASLCSWLVTLRVESASPAPPLPFGDWPDPQAAGTVFA